MVFHGAIQRKLEGREPQFEYYYERGFGGFFVQFLFS